MKIERHLKIFEILENNDIETQEELANMLKEEGFDVTQATVSRDIRELNLTKITVDGGKQKYCALSDVEAKISDNLIRVFKESVLRIDYAQNIIVIKTINGMGMAVGVALDNMQNIGVLGTIAGDDTVFCVSRTQNQAISIIDRLNRIKHS